MRREREPLVIDVEEAVRMSNHGVCAYDIYAMHDFLKGYDFFGRLRKYGGFEISLSILCAIVWNAGRAFGIRSERAYRRSRGTATNTPAIDAAA